MNNSPTPATYFHEPPTPSRGIDYADGGIASLTVHHPDPARIAAINAEWAAVEGEREEEG